MQQTYRDLQIICVNDGSTDNSHAILQAFAEADSRIEIVYRENGGLSCARNTGMDHAKGEYLLFVDADDSIEPDCIERLIDAAGKADIVQYGYTRVTEDGLPLFAAIPRHLYRFTTAWSRLYRRSFLERNNLRFIPGRLYEDILFSIQLWTARPKHVLLAYTGYHYTINPAGITSQTHLEQQRQLMDDLKRMEREGDRRMRLITAYTRLRLKLHFMKEKHTV